MSQPSILNSPEVSTLERLIEEAMRSSEAGVRRFIEPASGTLDRATARQHHLVFGRRGSGKSSLLRKAAADLTVDRRPIGFVDMETFKGHAYPDVLLSVLIETFSEFAKWLETAAIAPANKKSFWATLFGTKPSRPGFNKQHSAALAADLRKAVTDLRDLLFSEDDTEVEAAYSASRARSTSADRSLSLGYHDSRLSVGKTSQSSAAATQERRERFKRSKLQHLHRHILDYQALFKRMSELSDGDAFLFLDDLYHIRRSDQAHVVDYFHRIAKGSRLWLKIGTIRHRTTWYVHGDPPIGAKIGDDVSEIDLDLTLEKYKITSAFLEKVLDGFLSESNVKKSDFLARGALDRLVLASGGVARDFLGLVRRSILIARERGDTSRGSRVGVEDVNAAAGEYDSSKREELSRDAQDERQRLEDEFAAISTFVNYYSNANVFLVDKSLPESHLAQVEELVDLRLLHRVRSRVTVADRPGKTFEAYMLDVSQYTASRKRRDLELIPFWKDDAKDAIRRPGLIYKEFINNEVVTKNVRPT